MDEALKKLVEAREKLGLSIEEVSFQTKIRQHIIEALENGNITFDSPVYIKSHLKAYASFLKLPLSALTPVFDELNSKLEKENTPQNNIENGDQPKTDYTKIFKEKKDKKAPKVNILNTIIYVTLTIAIAGIVYITFFTSDSDSPIDDELNGQAEDTTIIDKKDKNLFSYFEEPDSLRLTARAVDSAWLRIDIDGKRQEEMLMTPNQEKTWTADNYFLITQGNVGAIQYYRNGKKLPPIGNKGTVVKNLKITKDNNPNSRSMSTQDTVSNQSYKPPQQNTTRTRSTNRSREEEKVEDTNPTIKLNPNVIKRQKNPLKEEKTEEEPPKEEPKTEETSEPNPG